MTFFGFNCIRILVSLKLNKINFHQLFCLYKHFMQIMYRFNSGFLDNQIMAKFGKKNVNVFFLIDFRDGNWFEKKP